MMTSARIVAVSCVFTTDFALGVWCKPDWLRSMVPRGRTSTLSSQRSNKCAYRSLQSPILLYFGLNSSVCDSAVKFPRPAKYSEPSPPSSVEVSVRENRSIQRALPIWRLACEQTSFNCRDFDFRFPLCPPIFTFLRVSFLRTRSSVTKT